MSSSRRTLNLYGSKKMRPICVECRIEMYAKKNGFIVYRNNDHDGKVYMVLRGDYYKCPNCGGGIITGFGHPMYVGEFEQQHLQRIVNHAHPLDRLELNRDK